MRNRRRRHIAAAACAVLLIGAQAFSAAADTADEIAALQNQQAQTGAELEAAQSQVAALEQEKAAITQKLDDYQMDLVNTITSIKSLDSQIDDAQKELEVTGEKLDAAREQQQVQYEAMKKRIQYLYESTGSAGWASILLDPGNLSAALDDVENTQSLYEYDRKELEDYMEAVDTVTALETEQVNQMSELETMKCRQEEEQGRLEELVSQAKADSAQTEEQLGEAYAVAESYLALINEQAEQMNVLIARQQAEEEAARLAAEEAARKQAEEEAKAKEEAEKKAAEEAAQQEQPQQDVQPQQPQTTPAATPAPTKTPTGGKQKPGKGGVTGQDVVNYALQFVGNPYVSGGTSLTNGCDCSGFTMSVYAHFGYSIARGPTAQGSNGIGVSYSELQPGDLIIYCHGHATLYIGGGKYVHAANPSLGICIANNIYYKPVLAFRRIIY